MNERSTTEPTPQAVELVLRDELLQGDLAVAAARPILRHLLTNDDQALFSDEIVARVRGTIRDIAGQLLEARALAAGSGERPGFSDDQSEALAQALFADAAFLAHAHALAIEAQLLERVRARSGIDPVLTPLVQELAAGSDASTAGLAMAVLAAQARFVQYHRRMELPLRDLPGDLFHKALIALSDASADCADAATAAERRLREEYDERAGRPGLLARLVSSMGGRAARALALDHSGLSIFATALAMASGQDRDLAVVSLSGRQFARLALSLRAAGLQPEAVEAQFAYLHPEIGLPDGFGLLRADAAATLLTSSSPEAAL